MSTLIPFDAITIGTELGPVETHVSPQRVREYCQDWADPNPWYLTDSPFGGPVAQHARVGDELETCEKVVYQRALAEREFSAESIHNDAYTRRLGYPGALVSAYVLCGYMSELHTDHLHRRVVLDVWMEKASGARPVVGTANALVPAPSRSAAAVREGAE